MKFILFVSIIILSSCDTHDKTNPPVLDGTYSGTFQRKPAFGSASQVANVSVTFASGTWTGQSDIPKYPALCHGTYKFEGQKIVFTNDCAWTAEFDWSLILGGEYDYTNDFPELRISRDYRNSTSDTYIDEYLLIKQK